MAILKHLQSKNANYNDAIQYLTMQFNEHLDRPILDENGLMQEREEYRIAYFSSDGEKNDIENWEKDCIKTNLKYNKSRERDEIKSHQWVLSFEADDNLSIDEVQNLTEEFALQYFSGHQILVAAHPGHGHIILNAVRDQDKKIEEWMQKNEAGETLKWQYEAGYKHHVSGDYLKYIRKETMDFCKKRGLNQIDLLSKSNKKRTNKEYYAEKKAEEKGKITYKDYIRKVIDEAKHSSKSLEEFYNILETRNIQHEKRGSFMRYKTSEGEKWIRDKTLGTDYQMDEIMKCIEKNNKRKDAFTAEMEKIELEYAISKAREEGKFSLETHVNRNGIRYQIGFYNENGTRRSPLEALMILAVTMINGEIPEFALPRWQQYEILKNGTLGSERIICAQKRINDLMDAIDIAHEMQIETIGELNAALRDKSVSDEDKDLLLKLKITLKKALRKEYCSLTDMPMIKEKSRDIDEQIKGIKKEKSKTSSHTKLRYCSQKENIEI